MILFRCFLIVLIFSTFANQPLWAQSRDSVKYRVYYTLEHIRDTSDRDNVYKEEMVLLLGDTSSMFVSYTKLSDRVAYREQSLQASNNANGEIVRISLPAARRNTPEEYIKRKGSATVSVKTYLGRDFLYEFDVPPINWVIHDDQKVIMDMDCFLATATFKGRDWRVWFNPELPIAFGPWLLDGLPGLVVKAVDSKNEVSYTFKALEKSDTDDRVFNEEVDYGVVGVTNENRVTDISLSEYIKLRKAAFKNPRNFQITQIHAMHGRGGALDLGLINNKSWNEPIPNPINKEELNW